MPRLKKRPEGPDGEGFASPREDPPGQNAGEGPLLTPEVRIERVGDRPKRK
jgi:hypothetical protein